MAADSRYAQIMRVMQETERRRPNLRRIGDQLGAWYTPVAITFAAPFPRIAMASAHRNAMRDCSEKSMGHRTDRNPFHRAARVGKNVI